MCEYCHYTCLTCSTPQLDKCLTCNESAGNRKKVGGKCVCKHGFTEGKYSLFKCIKIN